MTRKELKIMTALIADKERDLVVYEQAMINFSAMLRDGKFNPALLKHGSNRDSDNLVNMVYTDIKRAFPRDNDVQERENRVKELEEEVHRLRHRPFLQRLLNK